MEETRKTIKERLVEFMAYLKISTYAFEKSCGLSQGYVRNISKSIQPDKVERISRVYPQLNAGWLMTGEGSMIKEKHDSVNTNSIGDNSNGNTQSIGSCSSCPLSVQLAEKDKQIERLMSIIEKLQS